YPNEKWFPLTEDDEVPEGLLDARLRAGFRRWVFEELARQAIPAILVTHDREDCPPTGRCLAMERWQ
ncbi:hypothetical protein OPU76_01425, partial [Klebsiella pneumoniae]|nr:hypothetical protein [Klebsiella pneumoniae]